MPREILKICGQAVMKPVKELRNGDLFNLSISAPNDLRRMGYDRSRKLYKVVDVRSGRTGYISGNTSVIIDCEIWTERSDEE